MATKQEIEKQLAEALATIENLKEEIEQQLAESLGTIENLKEGIVRSNELLTEAKNENALLTKENKHLRADYAHSDANWAAALQENHRLKCKIERLTGRNIIQRILNR